MSHRRNRSKPVGTLQERLAAFAQEQREKAEILPEGPERTALLKKAAQADNTASLEF